jgi:Tfp pilus assembly protein PilF
MKMSIPVALVLAVPLAAACSMLKRPASEPPAPVARAVPSPVEARAAVQPEPMPARQPEKLVAAGLEAYENGNYPVAEAKLHAAVESGCSVADQVTAHKFLAFIACTSERLSACESHFRQALALDSKFTLTAAEAGHPAWGPVFRKLKAEAARKAASGK